MKREIERRIGGSVLLALLSLIKFVSEYLICKTKEAHVSRIVLGATVLILIVSNISVAASVKIDSELLNKIDQYAIDGYSSDWDITLDQYKAWVLAIAQGEGSWGGYTAHSQAAPGSDLFYHKDLSKFTFSTGIGPFQVDRGGYSNPPWEKWSTIEKLNATKALESTLLWHRSRFPGKGATLYDFANKSAWYAVKSNYWVTVKKGEPPIWIGEGTVRTRWTMITGSDNWDDFKNGVTDTNKDLKWDDVANLARVTNNPNYLYETNVRNLGKAKWNVKFTTDSLKDVTLNGQYDTFLIKARSASNNVLFSYYYTVDSISGTEVWAYDNEGQTDEFKYVFTREFGTGQNPEHRDGTFAGENKLTSPALEDIGLAASYYNEPIYRNNLETVANPDALRIDPNLNFAWHIDPSKRPAEIINDGWWSGDWKGYVKIDEPGTYRFRLESDDGSWLYIDGAMLINNGGDHSPRGLEQDLELEKGYHSLLVKYFESYGGEAVLKLEWKPPGKSTFMPIPLESLYVSAPLNQPAILKVSKKAPQAMSPGSEMTYTLYYQNFGGAYNSQAVLEDKLPTEVNFVSASDGKVPNAERIISWNIDSVAAFPQGLGSKTITVRINPDKVTAGTTVIENTATIEYGDQGFETKAVTAVVKSNLPESVTIDNTRNNIGGETSVFWQDPITFNYYSSCAESVAINIHMNEGGSDISGAMTETEDNKWSYTVPKFAPNHGSATVTYTIAGCEKTSVNFNIYIDPAGFIYDTATGTRISGASVWLQQPNGLDDWENVSTAEIPARMQPNENPLITNADGQYQWDVLEGIYRVHVEAPGYYPADSISVNIPPPVTDLNVGLVRIAVSDSTPPNTTLVLLGTLGNNNWYISDVEVNLTAIDNKEGAGVNITEYSFGNIAWNIYTVPFNVTTEGTTTVYYRSIDNADNSETVKTQTISIDKTPPNISITGVTNNSYYNSNVTITVNITDKNLYNQSVILNGYPYINGTDITAEGSYTLVALATDLAGNSASETLNFVIDKTPPETSISFNTTTKNITVYSNETGGEASYTILPTKNNKDDDNDDEEHNGDNEGNESGWNLRQYALQDQANNSFVLILKYKSEGKEAKAEIVSLQYNNGTIITVGNSSIEAEYSVDKNGSIKELEQKIKAQKQFEIEVKYSLKKNETEIKVKTKDQTEEKETRPGLVILEMLTDKGSLKYSY